MPSLTTVRRVCAAAKTVAADLLVAGVAVGRLSAESNEARSITGVTEE